MSMRQIKFRGKRLDNGAWIYGDLIHIDKSDIGIVTDYDHWSGCRINPDTLGQFTGLTDHNGKEIYEGDILSTDLAKSSCEVVFRNGCFVLCLNDGEEDFYDILAPLEESVIQTKYHAVIGNIHDNPSLMINQPTEV